MKFGRVWTLVPPHPLHPRGYIINHYFDSLADNQVWFWTEKLSKKQKRAYKMKHYFDFLENIDLKSCLKGWNAPIKWSIMLTFWWIINRDYDPKSCKFDFLTDNQLWFWSEKLSKRLKRDDKIKHYFDFLADIAVKIAEMRQQNQFWLFGG